MSIIKLVILQKLQIIILIQKESNNHRNKFMSPSPQKIYPQSPQFQILIDDSQTQYQSIPIEVKLESVTSKKINRSLMVSMIQDEDIISDYFLPNQKEDNSKQEGNTEFQKLIDEKTRDQQNHKQTTMQKQQKRRLSSLHKRGFHYQSTKKEQQQSMQQKSFEQILPHQQQTHEHHASRMQIQKQKYNLHFEQVYGEIFIYISECQLIGYNKEEYGYFLLTNYRVIFFKFIPDLDQTKKRVDLPFGFVKSIQYQTKRKEISFQLHYEHYWKFYFQGKEHFDKIKLMLDLYAKTKDIKSSFAFSYALKAPDFNKSNFSTLKEYSRMHLIDVSLVFPNQGFRLSESYPPYICLPHQLSDSSQVIKSICQNFKGNKLPILTFRFGGEQWTGLWLSGTFVDDHKLNEKQLKTYYSYIRGNSKRKIYVYDCNLKSSKGYLESSLDSKIENRWINLHSNSQIITSYNSIVQAYIVPANSFFSDIISSKWYDMVLNLLKNSFQIAEKLFGNQPVLIKQDDPKEKSLIISALIQIILQPFYRTLKGFKYLVMKEFICFGYKFASRLGNRDPNDQCPTFILFLDAIAQLIHLNPLYFQFNSKYLAKLSNLMYTNIFGTFLADSPKQFFLSQILQQTVQVWQILQSQLTRNAFYQIRNGILTTKPHTISDLRFWVEHFTYLTGQSKDCYKMHPLAESTMDYVSLECLKVKNQNYKLKTQLEKQRQSIIKLKQLIELKNTKK